ncbi:MAG: ammonia monooxygenase [Methylotenera sp.]|nr:MAG: ammonia monooxygenase [Methylotenera sp.]
MSKILLEGGQAVFYCNGCKRVHIINLANEGMPKWGFNGSEVAPTFTPSILSRYKHPKGYSNDNPAPVGFDGEYVTDVCHSFVTDGKIQYLGDCTHELAGQTIELPEFKWDDEDD